MKNYTHNQGFYHIKPMSEEILNKDGYSKEIEIKDPQNQLKELEYYNKQGYNIYITFNSFLGGKRKIENINELKHILVDIDYKDGDIKEDYISIRRKAKELEHKYGIFPIEINETANGYHLLYKLAKDLAYIKNDIYLDISSALNGYFSGDVKAKQITGLRKLPGFIDYKPDIPFLIINKYTHPMSSLEDIEINHKTLIDFGTIIKGKKDIYKKKVFGIDLKLSNTGALNYSEFDKKRNIKIQKIISKIDEKGIKGEIYDLIESIDARVLIDRINDSVLKNRKKFDKFINIGKDNISIENTGGLKLYDKGGITYIKDFAKKYRYGNRYFLLNHYFQVNKQGISDKEKKDRLLAYSNFLKNDFGIRLAKSQNNFFISSKLLYDVLNKNIFLNLETLKLSTRFQNLNIKLKDEELTNNKSILNIVYLYLHLEKLRQENYITNKKNITFSYKDILETLGLKNSYNSRKKLKMYLLMLQHTFIPFIKAKTGKKYDKNLGYILFGREGFDYNPTLGTNMMSDRDKYKISTLHKDLFYVSKGFLNDKGNFLILLYIMYNFNITRCVKISVNVIKDMLENLTGENYKNNTFIHNKIIKILKYAKSNQIIQYYYKNKNTYTLGKSKLKKISTIKN